jgi:outer membrane protein assembly factor BamB
MRMPPARASNETMRVQTQPAETMRLSGLAGSFETQRSELGTKDTHAATPLAPLELPSGAWEAPPVRVPGGSPAPETLPLSTAPAERTPEEKARQRARWIIVGLTLLVGAFLGAGLWIFKQSRGKTEDRRLEEAREKYRERDFVEAQRLFHALEKDYPQSTQQFTYKFYADLSGARQAVYTKPSKPQDTRDAYQRLSQFLAEHHGEELPEESRADIRDTFYKLREQFTDWAREKRDLKLLAQAEKALGRAREFKGGDEAAEQAEQQIKEVKQSLRIRGAELGLLDRLKKLTARPTVESLRMAADLLRETERSRPDVRSDPEVIDRLNQLAAAHRRAIIYTPSPRPPSDAPREDSAPSLLVAAPAEGKLGFKPWAKESPVLALARGVLYALRPSDGLVRWATRVGIDTTVLPVRIPAHQTTPEIILVLSSDTNTLSALRANKGEPVWHRELTAPCLGRPSVVGNRLYLPCYNGRVDEIDTATGRLLGYYDLGQSLRLGAVYDEQSKLLYAPGDSFCVYALDLVNRECKAVLYSEHPSGSLRSEPTVLHFPDVPSGAPRNPNNPRSCLVLCQADGLEATRLRVFQLPLLTASAEPLPQPRKPGQAPAAPLLYPNMAPLNLDLRVRGWSWFPPYKDDEKLALATDAGVVGVFGIKQKNNRDKPLFPLCDQEIVLQRPKENPPTGEEGRAQVICFDDSNFWVLADGSLHRLRLALGGTGWQMTELWTKPVPLGSPLHAAQVDLTRKVLFLVTQSPGGQGCVASTVAMEAEADDKDKVKWQTQLGLLSQGQPIALPNGVLALDQRGGLLRFDADRYKKEAGRDWYIHEQRASKLLEQTGARPLQLLPITGGAHALIDLGDSSGGKLLIRTYDAAKNTLTDHPCTLIGPVTGLPGAWPDHLIFPVKSGKSGILMRKQVPGEAPFTGLDWKAPQADEDAPGYVVPLNQADFLVTDGSTGLIHMSWPKNDENCQKIARAELPARIVAPPVGYWAGKKEFRVFVADVENRLTLLEKELTGDSFHTVRSLTLDGKITAGPFHLGTNVGCVVDYRRLILVDARKNKELWRHERKADIVGRPILLKDLLIVADQGGHFVGLNPATGKERGKGYKLRANTAPAAGPVPFGPDRIFTPLADGTVLLLSSKRLQRGKK